MKTKTKAGRNTWSDAEKAILAEVYGDLTIRHPAKTAAERIPGRSPESIAVRASIVGLAFERSLKRQDRIEAEAAERARLKQERLNKRGAAFHQRQLKIAERVQAKAQRRAAAAAAAEQRRAERDQQRRREKARKPAQKAIDAAVKAVERANAARQASETAVSVAAELAAIAGIPCPVAAAGPPPIGTGSSALRPVAYASVVAAGAPAPLLRKGPCDLGDREHVRRRLEFTVAALAAELGRSAGAIAEAVRDLANSRFAAPRSTGHFTIEDLQPASERSFRGGSRSAVRAVG